MDQIQSLLFPRAKVRATVVSLENVWQHIIGLQKDTVAKRPLGELLSATALLASSSKVKASLTLQTNGKASAQWPFMVAKCHVDEDFLGLCGTSTNNGYSAAGTTSSQAQILESAPDNQAATLVASYQEREQQPYQAIIPIAQKNSIAEVIAHYLQQSVQIDSQIWLAADHTKTTGFLLQRLPDASTEAWHHLCFLAQTITPSEMLNEADHVWLHKLFWDEEHVLYPQTTVRFACSCNRQRVVPIIRSLGRDDFDNLKSQEGAVSISCSFCGQTYTFQDYPEA